MELFSLISFLAAVGVGTAVGCRLLLLAWRTRKLPELAKSMGSSITQFKKGLSEDDEPKALDDKSEEG